MNAKKLDPTQSKDEALRYLKKLIKHIDSDVITLELYSQTFKRSSSSVCQAFQQILFGRCGVCLALGTMDKLLQRFRSVYVDASTADMGINYNLDAFVNTYSTQKEDALYSTEHFIRYFRNQLQLEFYQYLTRNSAKKERVMKTLTLLRSKYSNECKWLHKIEKRCKQIFGGKNELTLKEFSKVIEYQNQLSEKIFHMFDQSDSGSLNVYELYNGLVDILTSDTAGRIRYLFYIYDADGSGTLNKQEVGDVLRMCVSESRLNLQGDLVEELCDIVWANVTKCEKDEITFDDFHAVLLKYPAVYENLHVDLIGTGSFGQVFRFLEKPKRPSVNKRAKQQWIRFTGNISTNVSLILVVIVYIIVSLALVAQRIISLTPRPSVESWYIVAKCAGQLLNLNIAFALILTLKHTVTRLRKTLLRHILPLDDTQFLHKMIAYNIMGLMVVHVTAHALQIIAKLRYTEYYLSETYFMDNEQCIVFFSGLILILVAAIFIITTLPYVKAYSYEIFIRTHQICALVWMILMLMHASSFWKWITGPILLFAGERLYFIWSAVRHRTLVESAYVHGNITQLTIEKPSNFKYRPGDYVNINIPSISRTEWHPFTISSSPQFSNDTFTLHIRKVGRWTSKLMETVKNKNEICWQDNKGFDEESCHVKGMIPAIAPAAFTFDNEVPPSYTDSTDSLSNAMSAPTTPTTPDGGTLTKTPPKVHNKSKYARPLSKVHIRESSIIEEKESDEEVASQPDSDYSSQTSDRNERVGFTVGSDSPPSAPQNQKLGPVEKLISKKQNTTNGPNNNDGDEIKISEDRRHSQTTLCSLESASRRGSIVSQWQSAARRASTLSRASSRSSIIEIPVEEAARLNWRVFLDGPYSTPSHDILKTQHAILVAGGIGITPFSSVLESVIKLLRERTKVKQCTCNPAHTTWQDKSVALQKIDFFWVTRDQSHLSWFHQIFREIEEQQIAMGLNPPLVNLHIYLTGLKKSEDIRGTFLQLAFEMMYQEESMDVLSGLKSKTKGGRPAWAKVLKEITKGDDTLLCPQTGKSVKMKPKLYTCGPAALCQELKHQCYKQDIVFKEEIF